MSHYPIIDVVIPAYNEEKSIGLVIADIPNFVRHIVVANNRSTDCTKQRAIDAGAIVVDSMRRGYGSACLDGIRYLSDLNLPPDILVFLDGDYSDHPDELPKLIAPIIEKDYDLVIGSRAKGNMERGAMMPAQLFGNWLATNLIRLIYGYDFSDLGPFRAIKWKRLINIRMEDPDYGWTVEMQVKAAKYKLRCTEVPVTYRKRIGVSKVSGTVSGTFRAGHKILWTIFKLL